MDDSRAKGPPADADINLTEPAPVEASLTDNPQKLKIAYEQTILYARDLNLKIGELKQAEKALRQNAADLAVLFEASQVFLSQNNIETTLQTACQLIVSRFDLQLSWVGVLTNDEDEIHPAAVYPPHDHSDSHPLNQVGASSAAGQELIRQAIHTTQAVASRYSEPEARQAQPAALTDDAYSLAALPLLHNGEVLGVMSVYSRQPDYFTPNRLQILQSFANLTAVALVKARLFERLQLLSQQLVDAQEAERRHIARELHDEIGQTLTAVKINLQAMQRRSGVSDLTASLQESMDIVEQAIQQVRNLSLDLRPSLLDDLGLVATLRWYLDRQASWAGLSAQLTVTPSNLQLPANLETVCFRLVQEALTNALRHAQAQTIQVDLQQHDKELQLVIGDDGLGFEVEPTLKRVAYGKGLGLVGMQERVSLLGGRFELESAPGQGTQIRVFLPVPPTLAEDRSA
ncbi:MAG: GAF domain-containing sensor histidine kinase [Anaerolineae bacterium]|nr:GAF domain-containing sensor histidine kinase [Anaerolineae bacterium]